MSVPQVLPSRPSVRPVVKPRIPSAVLQKVFENPERYNIGRQEIETKDLHVYVMPKGAVSGNVPVKMLLNSAQEKRSHTNDIIGVIVPESLENSKMYDKIKKVFEDNIVAHSKDDLRDFSHTVSKVNQLVRQYYRDPAHDHVGINQVFVHGQHVDAFSLGQLLHLQRKISPTRKGRPVVYINYQPQDVLSLSPSIKRVTFSRVDPKTGAYIVQGNQHVYNAPFTDQKTFRAKLFNSSQVIEDPSSQPVDVSSNRTAFKQIVVSDKEKFIRFVLSNQNVGAAKIFEKSKKSNDDEMEVEIESDDRNG